VRNAIVTILDSEDLEARLNRHNRGMVKAAKNCRPYFIKASKIFPTESGAVEAYAGSFGLAVVNLLAFDLPAYNRSLSMRYY
jgi:hypothetical protein